ncbi:MAG: hypothetical protein ACYDA1_08085 [Vulcanimicrobiaceae bacterium]
MIDGRWYNKKFTASLLRLLAGVMNPETREVAPVSQAQLDRLLSVAPDRDNFERDANANSSIREMRELGQIEVIRKAPAPYGYKIIAEIDDLLGCSIYAQQCRAELAALDEDVRSKAEEVLRASEIEREKVLRQLEWAERRRSFMPATLESVNVVLLERHECRVASFNFLPFPRKLGSFDLDFPQQGITILACAFYIDKDGVPLAGSPSAPNGAGEWITFANFTKELREDIGAMIAVAIEEAGRLANEQVP